MTEKMNGDQHPSDAVSLHELLDDAHRYATEYIDLIDCRPVFPDDQAIEGLKELDEPLPDAPTSARDTLRILHRVCSPATVAQTGGRYFGFVTGAAHPGALAARWLADVWDQNPALYVQSPAAAHLEQVCERWLGELLGLPPDTALGLVGGSSTSIFCGLAAARNELLRRLDWDVNAKGLFGAPPIQIVVGEQAHAAVFKALALLGLGREQVVTIPVDTQGRMRSTRLPVLNERSLIITQAGNVNSGAFDPFEEIWQQAHPHNAWIHVDGAFGLWAAASASMRHLCKSVEKADSWSADAHKTLNVPYDCGIVLCRHRGALVSAMQSAASYIQWSENRDNMLYTPEMSRRARAVELWATLKFLGKQGVESLIDQLCVRAQQFAGMLEENGFRILNDVVFNQVLAACDKPELTESTLARIQRSGTCWCGGAAWRGEPVIRISVCSWKTTEDDIEQAASAFVSARARARSDLRA